MQPENFLAFGQVNPDYMVEKKRIIMLKYSLAS